MKTKPGSVVGLTACVFLAAAVASAACGGGGGQPTATGTGGAGGSASGAGGSTSGTGGTTGTGGATAGTGGTTGTGGATGTGGTTGTGGAGGTTVAREYWISPTGVDTAAGTMAAPFKTLGRALQLAAAGVTIWIMPGTYPMTATVRLAGVGTVTGPIKLWAAAGARPVFDFTAQARGSANRGFEITGYNYHLRGFEVAHAGDNGILISGSGNTVEGVVTHDNEDTGIQITVSESSALNTALGANNLILNCDSYGNLDTATNGENADGFAAKLRIGAGNVFRGCRAWNNADDGYDLFAADDVVVIDKCWAFLNGKVITGTNSAGDGNGFKLGGAPVGPGEGGAVHMVTGSAAFDNKTCGFVRNNNPELPTLSNCAVHGNRDDYCNLTCATSRTIAATGDAAKAMPRAADGSLPALN